MALVKSGGFKRSGGVFDAIKKQMDNMNLKPVKRILIKFDPFVEKSNEVRKFNHLLVSERLKKSNLLCGVKTEILTDRSEGSIQFDLNTGEKFLFKCNNLTLLEIFQQYNKHITPLAPVEEPVNTVVTKLDKKKKKIK